ncbi:DUF397 domain-containing protein [Streptomyces chartreusis]|uniref:DUF397 domain-containing protein n=1 Tax=Streptomyces chartreusis TaxID=1969 RepID=UPI003D93362E
MPVGSHPASESAWFKSSYSGGNTTECVQAAFTSSVVLIRDSKRPDSAHLTISAGAWAAFVTGTRRDR